MFDFFNLIFHKVTSFVVAIMMAVGLGSAEPIVIEPPVDDNATTTVVAEEIEKEPVKKTAQVADVFAEPESEPEPAIAPAPISLPSPPVKPKTFTLPSGAVVDEYGNPVNSAGNVSASVTPAAGVSSATVSSGQSLPEGWGQLPSGKYVDPFGRIYDALPAVIPQIIQVGSLVLPEGWNQLPSGIYTGPDGNWYSELPPDVSARARVISTSQPKTPVLPEGWTQLMSGAYKDPQGNMHFTLPD